MPERPWCHQLNQWLTDLAAPPGAHPPRTYEQGVDYVLHVKDKVSPRSGRRAGRRVRTAGTAFEDTVPAL
ncbi:hypothetical protein [Streptomyces clavuligerus]|uniref:hypothetical protein n=1 Tax=Streptomyces clavuligerus TaxID=1901 RepID=UPI001F07FA14|nr:hypothetical protein [Streptomyces clavuligerus]